MLARIEKVHQKQQQQQQSQQPASPPSQWSELNQIYAFHYASNMRVFVVAHILQLVAAALTLLILALTISGNFVEGYKYIGVMVIFAGVQLFVMKKSPIVRYPSSHALLQLLFFIIFLVAFIVPYIYIFNPTFKQKFNAAENCEISRESRTILEDDTYLEKFQVLTIKFTHNNQTYQGCGCGSDKYQETIFQTKIEPFRYVSNEEMVSLNVTTHTEDDDISLIKMPSWMCQPFKNYTSDLIDLEASAATGVQQRKSLAIDKCYFNVFGNQDDALITTQSSSNYCSMSPSFVQIIFDHEPYFPEQWFALLLICTYFPFFSITLNWAFVMILLGVSKRLRVVDDGTANQINLAAGARAVQNKIQPYNSNNHFNNNNFHDENSQSALQRFYDSKGEAIECAKQAGESNTDESEKLKGKAIQKKQNGWIGGVTNSQINSDSRKEVKLDEESKRQQQLKESADKQMNDGDDENQLNKSGKTLNSLFSLPAAKQRKVLPPIQSDYNFEIALRESIKQDLEDQRQRYPSLSVPNELKSSKNYYQSAAQKQRDQIPEIVSQNHQENCPTPILIPKNTPKITQGKKQLKVCFKEIDEEKKISLDTQSKVKE